MGELWNIEKTSVKGNGEGECEAVLNTLPMHFKFVLIESHLRMLVHRFSAPVVNLVPLQALLRTVFEAQERKLGKVADETKKEGEVNDVCVVNIWLLGVELEDYKIESQAVQLESLQVDESLEMEEFGSFNRSVEG